MMSEAAKSFEAESCDYLVHLFRPTHLKFRRVFHPPETEIPFRIKKCVLRLRLSFTTGYTRTQCNLTENEQKKEVPK